MSSDVVLRVTDLTVEFPSAPRPVRAADGVGFEVRASEILGIVGESGSGKSVTLRSLIGLVPGTGAVVAGSAVLDGTDLLALDGKSWAQHRGSSVSMVFQDAMSSLNPVMSIGQQLCEVLRIKGGLGAKDAFETGVGLLERVGISAARQRMANFPHELSGGMRQRVMIALAIAGDPKVLLADEPTTALDVTIQDQILALLADLQDSLGMSMILVSHDLDVIGQACDHVCVMYAGRVLEYGTAEEVLRTPRHPYTAALLASVPRVRTGEAAQRRLATIGGQPPELDQLPPGCPFAPRCPHVAPQCAQAPMTLDRPSPAHGTACIRWGDSADD